MLSNACKYAIRAVLYLAMYAGENDKKGAKEIAKKLELPQPFLAKLLQQLAKGRIVSSTKGPKGGFYLSSENCKHPICEIVECIDGKDVFDGCFLGLKKCSDKNPCPVHYAVSQFKNQLLEDFREKDISQFVDEIKQKNRCII